MPADRFALAIRVSGEVHGIDTFGGCLQFRDQLFFAFDNFVSRREFVIDIHGQILLRQIFHVTQRSLYDVLLAEIFSDSFRLRRRFDDDERFSHTTSLSDLDTLVRV